MPNRNSLSRFRNLITLGLRVYTREGFQGVWRRLQIYGDISLIKMRTFFTRIFRNILPGRWRQGNPYPGPFQDYPADREQLSREVRDRFQNPFPAAPTVSIIIPVHNQIEHTLYCLLSIADGQNQAAYEIIIADDASTDDTPLLLQTLKGIKYIRNSQNKGFLVSCNEAAASANGQYLVFLNNDTRVHLHWLDNLLRTFSEFPNTGLAGSKLILPYGRLQEAGGVIWADGSAMNYGRGADPQNYDLNYVCEVDYVSGASMMLPRALWESLGGFDLTYVPAYYEDVDLAFRVRQAGYKVVYQPFSLVTHLEGGSHGVDLSNGIKRFQSINQGKFLEIWQATIKSHGSPAETPDHLQRNRQREGTLLFIDDYTPIPHHAGALLSEFYMTTLREAGYAVTFLPHVDLRFAGVHTHSLQRRGIECGYLPYVSSIKKFLRQNGHQFDYVIVSRATVATDLFDLIRQYCGSAKIIFNTIDLRFLRLQRAAELSGKRYEVEIAAQAEKMELDIIQRSDCTLVVSDAEQELLAKLLPGSNVSVVPFPVDIYRGGEGFDGRHDIVFVGSFRHDPNTDAVLYFTEKVWPLISDILPEARFVIAGPEIPERIKKLETNRILVRGFVDDLATVFGTAKISVAPLRYGAGIKGKVLTSLGYGVPCVATTVAAEGIGLTDGLNILIANTPAEIVDAVVRAFGSVQLWTSLSEHGQAWVQKNYSREVVSSQLLEVFDKLQDVRV